MHQSVASVSSGCAQHPPPPRGYSGQSRGWSIFQILCCPGSGHLPTPGPFPSFRHARGFLSEYNYTEDFIGKESRLAQLSRRGKNWWGVVKACSWFYTCISSLLIKSELHSEIGSYQRESTFFGYWIKFLLILFEKHPFVFIKLFITYNFTALY